MKFSENLKTQRILNGVKQEDIATLCDVTRSAVSNWENGRRLPHIDIIQSLANFFNVTMEDLLGTDIKYVKQLTKEETVASNKTKHFSKVPMIFALLTLVVVTLLTILIVPVVKDKYINNGNVNEVEYIDANSISKVSLVLTHYDETITLEFKEYLSSFLNKIVPTDNGRVYMIDNLNMSRLFEDDSWGLKEYIQFQVFLSNSKLESFAIKEFLNISYNNSTVLINSRNELRIFSDNKYTISFYISNNKYYLDVLQI